MAAAGDIAAKCIHFALGAFGAAGLYLAGRRLSGPNVGAIAATLFLVGPAGISGLLGCAYVEGGAAFAMIAASLAWVVWFQSGSAGYLRCAALLAGLAVCFKISSALFPVALLGLTFVAAARPQASADTRARWLSGVRSCLQMLPLIALPVLPWMIRAAAVTGNPVFPLFARWIPSRDFSAGLATQFDRFNRYMTWGNTFGRDWDIGMRSHVLFGFCGVLLLVGGVAIARARSWMARGTAAVVLLATVAQLMAAGLYIRYSIPMAAVIALPVLAGLGPLLSRRVVAPVIVGVTLLASLVHARRAVAQTGATVREIASTALGTESHRQFLLDHLGLYPLYEQVNHELPEGVGVMLSCYCNGFYIDRTTYCGEIVQDSLRYTSWEEFAADLRRLGIRYVIAPSTLAVGGPSPAADRSSVSTITHDAQVRVVRRLLSGYGHLLGTAADQSLYEVEGSRLTDLEAPSSGRGSAAISR
jgi:hypothetical protein